MFALAPRKFHSLLIAPSLFTFLTLFDATKPNNQPPVAVDDSYTIHGCATPLLPGVTANDSDPDSDPFSITSFPRTPAHGSVSRVGNSVSFCPAYGYVGADSFTYQICDLGGCAVASVDLNIVNQAPSSGVDSYDVHGSTVVGPFLVNDADPDGDPVTIGDVNHPGIATLPQHGSLSPGTQPDRKLYTPNNGYAGPDSFTYNLCDSLGLCTETTVSLNVINGPPNGQPDSYDVHGSTVVGPFLINDSDPDGDPVTIGDATHEGIATFPEHGTLTGIIQPDKKLYTPNSGYFGADGFSYNACDDLGICTQTFVTLNVVNEPPDAGNDRYTVRGETIIGPLRVNDSDPDGDPLSEPVLVGTPSHGTLSAVSDPDLKRYTPNPGYFGTDTFVYEVCDNFGACSTATVTLTIFADDGAENWGTASCNKIVGQPINVTNGNMYLQQSDYLLPGIGPAINITRTYNSSSQSVGLFGRGWSTAYEAIQVSSSTYVRWIRADGQATNFTRPTASGSFAAVEGDFHGSLVQNGDNSFTVSFIDGSVHRFNSAGKLTSLVDRQNNQATLTYTSNRLSSITDPFGRVLTVTTDTNGRITALRDSLAAIATYTYGSSGELLSATYPDNSASHFAYTMANGNLVLATVTDALGNILETHTYDSQGRAITSEKQGGVERYTLNFVSSNETDATDALGHVTRYFFDGSKGRNTVTSVEGLCSCGGGSQTQTWSYDNQLNMTSHTNALGQTATYTYDANGNQLSASGVLGTSSFTYNQFGEVLTATDAMGGVTTYAYDVFGNLLSVKDALDNTTAFTYDPRGQLLTMTNALGKMTTLTWDASGRLTQTKDALNNLTTFAYDARARLTKATDALNNATSFTYDAASRLIKITRADRSSISYTFDLAGRRTKITDPLGNATNFGYDGAYRLTNEIDALSKSVSYTYDLMSNLTGTTDQLGRTTNIAYDEFNRPTTIIYPPAVTGAARLQESIEYDSVGNVTKRIDTAGRVSTFAYDSANRLTSVTDPALQATQYEYNPRSNLTAVVDALNQRYEFDYDALSRMTSATRAGLQMSYAYDAVGNRTQRTDYNGATTGYTYDALNRLTTINYPDATTATYAYDVLSQLTSATNANGVVSFVYDKLGRVTGTTDVWGQPINYTYDASGRRSKMSLGSGNKATAFTYAYDAINRLTKNAESSKIAITYAYDDAGNLLSRTLPNGVVTTYSYDGLDRLTKLKDAKGATVVTDNNYSYNNAGQIVQNIDQSGARAYSYDALDRLTAASYPATGNESYAYDSVGNRTNSHRSSSYGYQPFNRLTNTDTAGYLYDGNGSMISKSDGAGATQFQWDFENRLTQVVTPSAGSVVYKYDALGRRVHSAPSTGAATNFTYDGDDVALDKTSTNVVTEYLNGPGIDNKIRQKSGTAINYFAQDHLGSTTALTDSNGALVERETYDAYGNSAGSARTRYGFTGRERDAVTGLLYYRARWYDPQLGRFISEDPIGLAGGVNSFAYVGNNPQNRKDPTGLYEIDVHYYLTLYLAKKTGCFKEWEAMEIANEDQRTDEDPDTMPGPGTTEQQRMQNRIFHTLHSGAAEGVGSPLLWQGAMNERSSHKWIGRYLHHLQDSYSHAGFTNDVWGHSPVNVLRGNGEYGDHANDKTASDPAKAMRMAGATWKALVEYGKAKNCHCNPKWDNAWGKEILDFVNVKTANPRSSTIDAYVTSIDNPGLGDPVALAKKRRILGLRDRYSGEW